MKVTAFPLLALLTVATAKHKGNKPAGIGMQAHDDIQFSEADVKGWSLATCKSIGGWEVNNFGYEWSEDGSGIVRSSCDCHCAHGDTSDDFDIDIKDTNGDYVGYGAIWFGYYSKLDCQRTGAPY